MASRKQSKYHIPLYYICRRLSDSKRIVFKRRSMRATRLVLIINSRVLILSNIDGKGEERRGKKKKKIRKVSTHRIARRFRPGADALVDFRL